MSLVPARLRLMDKQKGSRPLWPEGSSWKLMAEPRWRRWQYTFESSSLSRGAAQCHEEAGLRGGPVPP